MDAEARFGTTHVTGYEPIAASQGPARIAGLDTRFGKPALDLLGREPGLPAHEG